jgi:predicted DNA-binding helix-hairpin-helix protein
MIVGATGSSDATILDTAARLYRAHRLRRVYYTAFSPFPRSPLWLGEVGDGRVREHRLYEADWLMRHYGFEAGELTTEEDPNLSLTLSPKLAWALRHPEMFPIDVNTASREQLLRVPGLGVRSVDRLLKARRWHSISTIDLVKLRVRLSEARHFVITADHHPRGVPSPQVFATPQQQELSW